MRFAIFLLLIALSSNALATNNEQEKKWGLAFTLRSADIAFDTEVGTVTSVVPMMYYEGEHFFLRGIEGGAHLYDQDTWELNAIARMRFFDIPAEYQNEIQGDTFDFGFQWRNYTSNNHHYDIEVLTDLEGNPYGNVSSRWHFEYNNWQFMPQISARYKSATFNSQYYALEELTHERIGAGFDVNANIETRYHVASNFYLVGSVGATVLDNNAYQSTAVDQRWQSEVYLGFALFNDKSKPKKTSLSNSGYLRVSHGWATPSNIGEILSGDTVKDEHNNQLSSLFYGLPLTDELFNLPIDLYLTTGFAWHHKSQEQEAEQEYVLAIKAYYTIDWPVRWRVGIAEGLSYVSDVTYIEKTEMEEKGYHPSKLMNYIDFTLDVNLGDIFGASSLSQTWLGYGIHHRSSIFESASQFGRIKGGSNYNTVYLQFDF